MGSERSENEFRIARERQHSGSLGDMSYTRPLSHNEVKHFNIFPSNSVPRDQVNVLFIPKCEIIKTFNAIGIEYKVKINLLSKRTITMAAKSILLSMLIKTVQLNTRHHLE